MEAAPAAAPRAAALRSRWCSSRSRRRPPLDLALGLPTAAPPTRSRDDLPLQVATLDRDKIKFLTKKLVHLTVLLEQDTVADDAKYPSFYSV